MILTVIYWFTADSIISIFIDDAAVIEAGVPMLRALMFSAPVLGIMFVLQNALQAMAARRRRWFWPSAVRASSSSPASSLRALISA